MNLETAIETYLTAKAEQGRRSQTLAHYRRILTAHAAALGPGRDVGEIAPSDVAAWIDANRAALSANTQANYYDIARGLWEWLRAEGHVERSPVQARVRRPRVSPVRSRAISPGDEAAMLAAARNDPRDYALLRFLADTGARVTAVARVRVGDLDLKRRRANLLEKGGLPVVVRYGHLTAEALSDWLAVRPAWPHDYVFASYRGTPLTRFTLYGILKAIARVAGVEGRFNPHSFRHKVGKDWFDAGKPIPLIQGKLNHLDPGTTAKYYANRDEEELEAGTEELAPPDPSSPGAVTHVTATGTVLRAVRSA